MNDGFEPPPRAAARDRIPATAAAPARRGLLAAALALATPTVGCLHAGRPRLAVAFALLPYACTLLLAWTRLIFVPFLELAVLTGWALARVVLAVALGRAATRTGVRPRQAYQRWPVYAGVLLLFGLASATLSAHRGRWLGFSVWRDGTTSMVDTVRPGEVLLADAWAYRDGREPERGDVVVHMSARDPGVPFVHRVVGLPGETVSLDNGRLRINGVILAEPYVRPELDDSHEFDGRAFTVPPGCYFTMGDNRDHSIDSRFSGAIPLAAMRGRVRLIAWSATLAGPRWERMAHPPQ